MNLQEVVILKPIHQERMAIQEVNHQEQLHQTVIQEVMKRQERLELNRFPQEQTQVKVMNHQEK